MSSILEQIGKREITLDLAMFLASQNIKLIINDGRVVDIILENI